MKSTCRLVPAVLLCEWIEARHFDAELNFKAFRSLLPTTNTFAAQGPNGFLCRSLNIGAIECCP